MGQALKWDFHQRQDLKSEIIIERPKKILKFLAHLKTGQRRVLQYDWFSCVEPPSLNWLKLFKFSRGLKTLIQTKFHKRWKTESFASWPPPPHPTQLHPPFQSSFWHVTCHMCLRTAGQRWKKTNDIGSPVENWPMATNNVDKNTFKHKLFYYLEFK